MQIIVLFEPGLPSTGRGISLVELLRETGLADIRVINLATLLAEGVQGDVFCNAHGEIYPLDIEPRLLEFFRAGGGLLHVGGAPFETAMSFANGSWEKVVRTFGDLRNHEGAGALDREVDVFRAQLGMMTYAPDYALDDPAALRVVFDGDLVGCPPWQGDLPQVGLSLATTIPLFIARPELYLDDHRAYQAKPLVRESHCAGVVMSPDGTAILTTLLLAKSWGNPYQLEQSISMRPWALYTGACAAAAQLPDGLLAALLRWLQVPIVLPPIDLPLSTLHAGETVTPRVYPHGALPTGWRVAGYQRALSLLAIQSREDTGFEPESPVTLVDGVVSIEVTDDAPATLLHAVRFAIIDSSGRTRDYVDSAVVVWRPEKLAASPALTANGRYFDITSGEALQRSSWVQGTNWQDRHQFAWTWHNPNPLRIMKDAIAMARAGLQVVRPHYFMPGWMSTVPGEVYADCCPEYYTDFELGSELSERHLRAIETHVMLFNSFGVALMPTLYTNICPTMGNAENWMDTSRMVAVPGLRAEQRRFAEVIMARFGGIPGLLWDLCNEINTNMSMVGDWARELQLIWGGTGQAVGVGTFTMKQNMLLGEAMDWHSVHIPCCRALEASFHSGKPMLLQEAWVPTPATEEGEQDLEDYLHRGISWTLRLGGAGFMPWNWNMMLPNWRAGGSFVEYWDNELGCAVHGDATPRRGRTIMRNWAHLLKGISFDQSAGEQVIFVYPLCGMEGGGVTEYVDILNRLHIPFRAVNDSDIANCDLSKTKLVILPYYGVGYCESTWQTIRLFAGRGGVVWAHNDSLQTDEQGAMARERIIPPLGGTEQIGAGAIHWCQGWNGGSRSPLLRLETLLESMPLLHAKENEFPLAGGILKFTERLSTEELTMKTDWGPSQKLPDRQLVTKIEVVDNNQQLERGWSWEGEPFIIDGIMLACPTSLFLWKEAPGQYLVAGENIQVTGCPVPPQATLLSDAGVEYPIEQAWTRDNDTWRLSLSGWQQRQFIRLMRKSHDLRLS